MPEDQSVPQASPFFDVLLENPGGDKQFTWKTDLVTLGQKCSLCVTGLPKQVLVVLSAGFPGTVCEASPFGLDAGQPDALLEGTDVAYRVLVGPPDADLPHLLMHRMMPSVLQSRRSLLLFCGLKTSSRATLSEVLDDEASEVVHAVETALRTFPAEGRVLPLPSVAAPPLPSAPPPRQFDSQLGGED